MLHIIRNIFMQVPFTDVCWQNGFFTESYPGKGDYHSVCDITVTDRANGGCSSSSTSSSSSFPSPSPSCSSSSPSLTYGDIIRFWGNQCRHFNVENTSNFTRMSVDLRVIPFSVFSAGKGTSVKAQLKFDIGGYYDVYPPLPMRS